MRCISLFSALFWVAIVKKVFASKVVSKSVSFFLTRISKL
jgi:hypothetical protein